VAEAAAQTVRWATIGVAGVLVAGLIVWSAAPISGAREGARPALILAIIAGVASIAQLALAGLAPDEPSSFDPVLSRLRRTLTDAIMAVSWPELLIIAVLVLEVLHRSRPWHTAVLGVALLGFLLSAHLAETGARAAILRPQIPVLAVGIALIALSVGAAALPGLPSGAASSAIRVIAALAAVIACALAVPTWLNRDR
jgi:hypothetical protein